MYGAPMEMLELFIHRMGLGISLLPKRWRWICFSQFVRAKTQFGLFSERDTPQHTHRDTDIVCMYCIPLFALYRLACVCVCVCVSVCVYWLYVVLFAEIVRQLNALSSIDGDPDDCLKQANKPASSSEGLSAFTFFHSFIHILSLSHSHFHSLSLSFSYSPLFSIPVVMLCY